MNWKSEIGNRNRSSETINRKWKVIHRKPETKPETANQNPKRGSRKADKADTAHQKIGYRRLETVNGQ